jgi:hypothetical protein
MERCLARQSSRGALTPVEGSVIDDSIPCDMFAIPALERPEHYKLVRRPMLDVVLAIQ